MSASLRQDLHRTSSAGSPFLSREEHEELVCGKGTGPAEWRQQQQRQQVLEQQTRDLADGFDELAAHVRIRLADELADSILPFIDDLAGESAYYWDRDAADVGWEFGEALRRVGRLLEDLETHSCDVIAAAGDILRADTEATSVGRERRLTAAERRIEAAAIRGDDMEIDETSPAPAIQGLRWPRFDTVYDYQAVRSWLRKVLRLPWARPRPAEQPELVGLVTGESRSLEPYRDLRMLPLIAQRERRPLMNGLRYWLENCARCDRYGAPYARFVVVTAGQRVRYSEDLQQAIRRLQRKVSKWAKISADEWGVDLVFRGTEMTLSEDGAHVHANLVTEPRGYLGEDDDGEDVWGQYLRAMHRHFGAWVKDNQRVGDVREIVKYVCKPTDLIRHVLNQSEARRLQRLEWLYDGLLKTRLVAFHGAAKELWRSLEERKLKPGVVGERVRLIPKYAPPEKSKDRKPDAGENVILCFGLASRTHTPWAEPSVLVLGRTDNPSSRIGQQRLEAIQSAADRALAAWQANDAPAPATAVAIARAWRAADDDQDARKIRALGVPTGAESAAIGALSTRAAAAAGACAGPARGGAYIVHTDSVSVQSVSETVSDWLADTERGPDPGGTPPDRPPDRPFAVSENGTIYDPETGEVVGVADRAA